MKEWVLGIIILSLLGVILALRNRFSFSWSDEAFYMAEVHRLYLGDKPLVDDWNPAQFYAVIIFPLYHLYVKWNGSTDGIYLWARNVYLLLSFGCAVIVFYIMRRRMKVGRCLGILAGGMIMLYSRANVGGLSYHNLFLCAYIMANMLLFHIISYKKEGIFNWKCKIYCLIVGALLGMAMITIPYLVLPVVIVYVILILMYKYFKSYFLILLLVGGGIAGTGLAYLMFLFSRLSVYDLMDNVKFLFMEKDHGTRSLFMYLSSFWQLVYSYGKYLLGIILFCIIVNGCCLLFRIKISQCKKEILYLVSGMVFMYNVYCYSSSHMSSYLIFGLFGIVLSMLLVRNNRNDRNYWRDYNLAWFYVSAIVVIVTFSMASATSDPMTEGFVMFSLMTIVLISQINAEWKSRWDWIRKGINLLIIFLMLGMTMYIRIFSVYRDAPLEEMDSMIAEGPARGLITTRLHAQQYSECMEVLHYMNAFEENKAENAFWVTKLAPWMYVGTNLKSGAPSPWRHTIDDPLLTLYYETHDIMKLKYILVLKDEYGEFQVANNVEGTNLTPNENVKDGEIWEEILENYDLVKFKCGNLYIRREV